MNVIAENQTGNTNGMGKSAQNREEFVCFFSKLSR